MSPSVVAALMAFAVIVAFCGGFGSCLMLMRRIDRDAPE